MIRTPFLLSDAGGQSQSQGDTQAMTDLHQPGTNQPTHHLPLTEEERQRGYQALRRSEQRLERMRQERDGQPFPSSWRLIRQMREKRANELDRR